MGNFVSGVAQYFYRVLLETREEAQERVPLHFDHLLQAAQSLHDRRTQEILLGEDSLVSRYFINYLCRGIRTSVLPHPNEQRRQLLEYFDRWLKAERLYFRKQERLALRSLEGPTSRL